MNSLVIPSEGMPTSNPGIPNRSLYATMILAVLLGACDGRKEKVATFPDNTPASSGAKRPIDKKDTFCSDIKSKDFHSGVISKIQQLQLEVPQLQILLNWTVSQRKNITFYDESGLITYQAGFGVSAEQTRAMTQNAGASTSVLPDGNMVVYLSPTALQNKSNFVEALANELLNAFMETQLPKRIKKKQWPVGERWGIHISPADIDGIGIEFTKEFISWIVSEMIREQSEWIRKQYSLEATRNNLKNGRFHETDEPGYAFNYFHNILLENWFPRLSEQDLLLFYQDMLHMTWLNISNNLSAMWQWLWLDIQP